MRNKPVVRTTHLCTLNIFPPEQEAPPPRPVSRGPAQPLGYQRGPVGRHKVTTSSEQRRRGPGPLLSLSLQRVCGGGLGDRKGGLDIPKH